MCAVEDSGLGGSASAGLLAAASASAPLLGSGLGGRGGDDVDDQQFGVGLQGGARGQLELAGQDLGADLEALDRDLDLLGDVQGVGLEGDGGGVLRDQGAGSGLTGDDDGNLDGDLLALLDDEQVGVLDVVADRVDDDRLGERDLLRALDVEGQDGVGAVRAQDARRSRGRAALRWRGSSPWPYRTAGTWPSRRARRAAPLPNSVRTAATRRLFVRHGETAPTAHMVGSLACGVDSTRGGHATARSETLEQ